MGVIVRSYMDFVGTKRCVGIFWYNTIRCCFNIWSCEVDRVCEQTYKRLIMELIDKDTLVAEIERLDTLYHTSKSLSGDLFIQGLFCFLDALEVKEVDLEKELDSMITPELKLHKALPSLFDVAKHFFELGLRSTITEEDCKLIWNIGDDIPNMPEEEFFKELLKRYKAQKGE